MSQGPIDIYFIDKIEQVVDIIVEQTGVLPCARFSSLLELPVDYKHPKTMYQSDDKNLLISISPKYAGPNGAGLMLAFDVDHYANKYHFLAITTSIGWCQIHVRCRHVLHMP